MFRRKDTGSAWRSRFPEVVTCVRCLQERDTLEVDRLLWCKDCSMAARRRAARWGWGVGGLVAGGLALWIWLVIRPSALIRGGWVATVAAAFWLVGRLAGELAFGLMRYRNRRAVEAVPPAPPGGGA